jgi:Zn-dependent protease
MKVVFRLMAGGEGVRQSLRLGRVAGIPVGAHWTVAVILVIIVDLLGASVLPAAFPRQPAAVYWAVAIAGGVVFLASLLAHELAHALVARRNGVSVRSVTLWMLGGVTQLDGEPVGPGAELRIALAGPATSLLAAGVFAGAASATSYAAGPRVAVAALTWLALMNGVLAVFNLLPGMPLDGGRVLRAALWRRWGDRRRADRGAAVAGRVIGVGIGGLGVAELLFGGFVQGLWLMLIGWFMASAAATQENASAAAAALEGVRVADVMTPDPDLAPGWATVADFIHSLSARPAQAAFPVTAFDGTLAGIVTLGQLGRIPWARRPEVRLSQVALPVPPEYRTAPDDPAVRLLGRPALGGEVAAVVLTGDRIVGLVTVADLRQTIRWRTLAEARA